MAEDIILRLKGEDVSASAVLRSVTAEAERLGVVVEHVGGSGAGGSGFAKMADEADVLGFNIEQVTRDSTDLGDVLDRTLDPVTPRTYAAGLQVVENRAQGVATSFATSKGKADEVNLAINKMGTLLREIDPQLGTLVTKWGLLGAKIGAVVLTAKALGDSIEKGLNLAGLNESGKVMEFINATLHDMQNPLDALLLRGEAFRVLWGSIYDLVLGVGQQTEDVGRVAEEKAAKAFAEFRDVVLETNEAWKKFASDVAGLDLSKAESEIQSLLDIFKVVSTQEPFLDGPFSEELFKRVNEFDAALVKFPGLLEKTVSPETLEKFQKLKEEMQFFGTATDEAAKSQLDMAMATRENVKELDKQLDTLRDLRAEIDGVGANVLRITGDIRGMFAEAAAESGESIEAIRAQIAALRQEEDKLARAFNTTEAQQLRRQEIAAEVADLERKLIDEQRKNSGAYELSVKDQIDIQSKFRDALAAAESQIQKWPESARGAMQAVIDRFQFLNDEVEVSERDVKDFEIAFKGAMAAAGSATTTLETKLQIDLRKAQESYKAFAEEAIAAYALIREEQVRFSDELRAQIELVKELSKGLQEMAA